MSSGNTMISGTATRRNAKLKYIFEEIVNNDERDPAKFYGYQDEGFNAGAAGNASYAIMIYDVSKLLLIHSKSNILRV